MRKDRNDGGGRPGAPDSPEREASRQACSEDRVRVNRGGRPTLYNETLARDIADTFATCETGLERLCEQTERFPCPETVRNWMKQYEDFGDLIAIARARKAERLLYSALEDLRSVKEAAGEDRNARINAARYLADYKMWLARMLEPDRFSSRAAVDIHPRHHQQPPAIRLTEDTIRQLQELSGESVQDAEHAERPALPEPGEGDGEG